MNVASFSSPTFSSTLGSCSQGTPNHLYQARKSQSLTRSDKDNYYEVHIDVWSSLKSSCFSPLSTNMSGKFIFIMAIPTYYDFFYRWNRFKTYITTSIFINLTFLTLRYVWTLSPPVKKSNFCSPFNSSSLLHSKTSYDISSFCNC